MRKTKIVCTIGPASTDEKIITDMCKAGMNVARLNFSHGTHEEQQKKIEEKFAEAIEIARTSGISLDKLTGLLTLMYQEDDKE